MYYWRWHNGYGYKIQGTAGTDRNIQQSFSPIQKTAFNTCPGHGRNQRNHIAGRKNGKTFKITKGEDIRKGRI